jgi:hypothetical protein
MLSFAAVYFFESRLFNALGAIQVKKTGFRLSLRTRGLSCISLSREFGRSLEVRPLPLGLARLVVGKLAGLLQVRLHRFRDDLVGAEIVGDAVILSKSFLRASSS